MTVKWPKSGIARRLGRTIVFQLLLVSIAAVLGIQGASWVIEELLVKEALETEAEHFWDRRDENPTFDPPDTRNLTGYVVGINGSSPTVPDILLGLPKGYSDISADGEDYSIAYVSERNSDRVILVFDADQVRELTFFYGVAPLAVVLILIYSIVFIGYRFYRRSVSPVIELARKVERLEIDSPSAAEFELAALPLDTDSEVVTLTEALNRLIHRTNDFISRERTFTRDASHELRSPLTVIRIAADLLLAREEIDKDVIQTLTKIKRSVANMEKLVEAFLLLARESNQGLTLDSVSVKEILEEQVENHQILLEGKPVSVELNLCDELAVIAPRQVLSVLFSNLIRNAMSYTDRGCVTVSADDCRVVIEDSGIGMSSSDGTKMMKPFVRGDHKHRGGHGVGLTIVNKISSRFGWPVKIESERDVGTRVEVDLATSIGATVGEALA